MSYWHELTEELKLAAYDLRDEFRDVGLELNHMRFLAARVRIDTSLYGGEHEITRSSAAYYVLARDQLYSGMAWHIVCEAESIAWQRAYLPTSD